MEHGNHHLSDIEQELHDIASRLSLAYKCEAPDRRLLENVLAKLPELSAASQPELPGIESPYRRYFAFFEREAKYLVPVALVVVLVVALSLRLPPMAEPARLAQDSAMPEAAPMAVTAEDTGPSLMMVPDPAPEDAAGARMMAPSAKMVKDMVVSNSSSDAVNNERIILGEGASRSYEIVLPVTFDWKRSTIGSTVNRIYGTPVFDERFNAVLGGSSTLSLVIQSNSLTGITPLFSWSPPYCLSDISLLHGGKTLKALAYSSLGRGNTIAIPENDRCPTPESSLSFGEEHAVELRVCVSETGIVSNSVVERGYEEFQNICQDDLQTPANADILRFSLSCDGPQWKGLTGKQECIALLQSILDSLHQKK